MKHIVNSEEVYDIFIESIEGIKQEDLQNEIIIGLAEQSIAEECFAKAYQI